MAHLIRIAAHLLSPDAPNVAWARATGCSHAAARKHRSGERRPSITALRLLQDVLREHARRCWAVASDIDSEIFLRQREPKPALRGCCARTRQARAQVRPEIN
jgi:hypothetical protein